MSPSGRIRTPADSKWSARSVDASFHVWNVSAADNLQMLAGSGDFSPEHELTLGSHLCRGSGICTTAAQRGSCAGSLFRLW